MDIKERTVLLVENDDWSEIVFNKAQYTAHDKQKQLEKSVLYMPSAKIVPLSLKLGENMEKPRFLENEGYYVGQKPYITKTNKNLMANRLLKQSDKVDLNN